MNSSRLFLLVLALFFAGKLFAQIQSGTATGLKQPVAVFNNWSAYDPMSDNIPQTEELCMKLFDNLIRLKQHGVKVDYYLMDAFWFDRDGGYRKWDKKNWPNGPQRWIDACIENGIKPGLWFSVNLIQAIAGKPMLNIIPEWQSSVTSDKEVLSLFEGGYLNHLMETLQIYVNMGVKMFKFDFAHFYNAATDAAKATTLPNEIEELNKQAFIQAIKKFRYKNPDIIFVGYNGFGGDIGNTVTPFRKTIDIRWLEIFETLYSGDPRISDLPMMNFWRSQDLYPDQMVQQFAFNGLPLSRIDNCSFMLGETGTCYKRGIQAWKGELILALARGGWLNVFHGNIDLLSDRDAEWFGKVQKTYMDLQKYGQTSIWGAIPQSGMPYGYVSSTKDGSLFTVVNPSQSIQRITLPENMTDKCRILFTDSGFKPSVEGRKLILGPEQLAVVGSGKYDTDEYAWGIEPDIHIPQSISPAKTVLSVIDNHTVVALCKPKKGKTLRIFFTQNDEAGIPYRSVGGSPPNGTNMDEIIKISAKQENKDLPLKIQYNKMIWSGLSWGAAEIDAKNIDFNQPVSITCISNDTESKNFKIEIYNVQLSY